MNRIRYPDTVWVVTYIIIRETKCVRQVQANGPFDAANKVLELEEPKLTPNEYITNVYAEELAKE